MCGLQHRFYSGGNFHQGTSEHLGPVFYFPVFVDGDVAGICGGLYIIWHNGIIYTDDCNLGARKRAVLYGSFSILMPLGFLKKSSGYLRPTSGPTQPHF